jgi:uncharacterized membrane protein YdjX (TVP38/TMEM64 family)
MEDRPQPVRKGRARLALIGIALVLALALATLVIWGLALGGFGAPLPGFELSADHVEELIESWGMWGVLGSIMLMVLHSFVPFPAEMVAIANGMLYGPLWGTLITWVGAMLGACLAFGLTRWFGRPFLRTVVRRQQLAAIDRWALRQGGGALLLSRFVPVISFNLINYAAGLTAISWWTFVWATGLGILPLTFLMVFMGDRLWSGEIGPWLWLALTALCGWIVWWCAASRRRRTDPTGPTHPKAASGRHR